MDQDKRIQELEAIQTELLKIQTELNGAIGVDDLLGEVEIMNTMLKSFWETEDTAPDPKLRKIIDVAVLPQTIKNALYKLFDGVRHSEGMEEQLRSILDGIDLFLESKEAFLYPKEERLRVSVLFISEMSVSKTKTYENLHKGMIKKLKEIGVNNANDNAGGSSKIKLNIAPNLEKIFAIEERIKNIKFNGKASVIKFKGASIFVDLAIEKNELTSTTDGGFVVEAFRKNIAGDFFTKKISAGITPVSIKKGWELPLGLKFTLKTDFLKFAQSEKKLENDYLEGVVKFEWVAFTAQLLLSTDELIKWLGPEAYDLAKHFIASEACIKISLSWAVSMDIAKQLTEAVSNKAEKETIKKMKKSTKNVEDASKQLAGGKADSKSSKVIKQELKAMENAYEKLASPSSKKIGQGLIKRAGRSVAAALLKRGLIKVIPIVNILSVAFDIYDIFWMGVAVYNHFNAAPGLSKEDAERLKNAREREFRISRKRDQLSEDPQQKKYVILRVFEGLAKNDQGMYKGRHKTDWKRFNIYLKFYDDSDTGSQYFFKPEKFKDRVLEEGEEQNVGKGVKVDFDYFKEVSLGEESSLSYDNHKLNNIYGDDVNALILHKRYSELEKRMNIAPF